MNVLDRVGGALGVRSVGVLAAAAALAVGGLLVAPGSEPLEVQAFSQTWSVIRCNGTDGTQDRGLHDDVPGAGAGNDAGYAYVAANDADHEFCIWGARITPARPGTFRSLVVRAAVGDGSSLIVFVRTNADCEGGSNLGTVGFGGGSDTPADNSMRTASVALSRGIARSVCIRVADTNASEAQRVSALIDNIALWTRLRVGWRENFARPN